MMGLAALALAGCVTAKVDYSLADVRAAQGARFGRMPVTLKIIDRRYADKNSVSSHAHAEGAYNQGVEFPLGLNDYKEVFKQPAGPRQKPLGEATRWYIAPDRLYWTPSGPIADLGARLGEHLEKAGCFARVNVAPPSIVDAGGGAARGATLKITINRLLALKERRPGMDTFGFFGLSALASSREIMSLDAEWTLSDNTGKEFARGKASVTEGGTGSCWRAKNKPFKLTNTAARRLGDALAAELK